MPVASPPRGDLADRYPDHDTAGGDQQELVVQGGRDGGHHLPAPHGRIEPADILAAAGLAPRSLELGLLAETRVGHQQDVGIVTGYVP